MDPLSTLSYNFMSEKFALYYRLCTGHWEKISTLLNFRFRFCKDRKIRLFYFQ